MALLRGFGRTDVEPVLETDRLVLRPPEAADYASWAAIRRESRNFLQPWEPLWPVDDLTRMGYRRRLKRIQQDQREGTAFTFFLFPRGIRGGGVLGGITLGNIRRGVTQSASIGYWMGERHAGQGYMGEAVDAILAFAFADLDLHRVEAACLPANDASRHLLLRHGFAWEGHARQYLKIAGEWRDHHLFARLATDDPRGPA
ncbi:MAG: GNAT family N-acetyltransferase [Alphaproteobacteria bacterium]|nr:GNAT family N-acetyltransferase [Alphaproteobacteria bacterium]MDX5369363.1 GNAT family N-acetyltransferase [Alphaproteobacteria bacterium]MDX5464044.1 GNAT family N-acetyltransferase [Alphaproteobacteria bacterium]